jgi:hypothetical protein
MSCMLLPCHTAPARCCSPRLPGDRCCQERTLLTLIERSDVCVGFVCWLRLDFVLVLFVLVLVSVLRFLQLACHAYNSFCLLSAPLLISTLPCHLQRHHAGIEP